MTKIIEKMQKAIITLLLVTALLIWAPSTRATDAAMISNTGNLVQNLYFTGSATNVNKWYQDGISTNPDIGLQLCNHGQKYVGAAYAINVNGVWKYTLISYHSSTDALAYTNRNDGSNCYSVEPSQVTMSPSSLTTPSPNVFYAAFPGKVEVAYADSPNPGALSNFVYADGNGGLAGGYTFDRSFSQSENKITVQTPIINFQTSSETFSKTATDPTFGLDNDKRRMVIGCCEDSEGLNCSDGYIIPTEKNFPISLETGINSVEINDQRTFTRYIVINGIGSPICIGVNLEPKITDITPNPIYYGQILHITFEVSNPRDTPYERKGGNVKLTDPFNVAIKIYNSTNPSQVIFQTTETISQAISPDGRVTVNANWPAQAHSGTYTVEVYVDPENNIKECDETDNAAKANFILKPVYIPNVKIDGVSSIHFGYPGVPYNFSIHLTNSDGDNVSNAIVQVVEENGLDIFAPTQIWNRSTSNLTKEKSGLKSYNIAEFQTDYRGNAEMTLIPTGNKLYSSEYNYTNVSEYVGNYKIYLKGTTSSGENLIFTVNNNPTNEYPLVLDNPYTYLHANSKDPVNANQFVKPIMEFVYEAFATFWKSIIR